MLSKKYLDLIEGVCRRRDADQTGCSWEESRSFKWGISTSCNQSGLCYVMMLERTALTPSISMSIPCSCYRQKEPRLIKANQLELSTGHLTNETADLMNSLNRPTEETSETFRLFANNMLVDMNNRDSHCLRINIARPIW